MDRALACDSLYRETRSAMGTEFTLRLYTDKPETAVTLFQSAFEEIERVEQLLSTYRPTSEISRINRLAGGETVTLDVETAGILDTALRWNRLTDGAFDPAVGALLDAWGFRSERTTPPTASELHAALARTGASHIVFSRPLRTLSFDTPGVLLDAGSFGKGYALDRVAALLRRNDVGCALLESGQSTYVAIGAPPGESGWTISIPDPEAPETVLGTVLLRDNALSTSGGSHRFVVLSGKKYVHIFDPTTGAPVSNRTLATVVAPRGIESDILSTALFVMEPDEGRRLIESQTGLKAVIVADQPESRRIEWIRWDEF